MLPNPPKTSEGQGGIVAYRVRLHNHASSLRSRVDRNFYRKDLAARAKFYSTLANKRPAGSDEATHFADLARLHQAELEAFGPDAPPKRRQCNLATISLKYPELPKEYTKRVHFLANGSLCRERSAVLAAHADALSQQTAPNGDVLLSVAVHPDRAQFFERLVESTGSDGIGPHLGKNGGFFGYFGANGVLVNGPGWEDPDSPWRRIRDDNFRARLYHWSLRRGQLDPSIVLPNDFPAIPQSLPYDPDPRFDQILSLTQGDHLAEAMELVEKILSSEREILFDEVIYLRYLVGQTPTGSDLRYLARKYIAGSSIRTRLEEEFDAFNVCLNEVLTDSGPIPDEFPGLSSLADILQHDPDPLKRDTPPLKDWAATREHYYRQYEAYGHSVKPRGRIFVWHPDIASSSLRWVQNAFRPEFTEAENRFRRERTIAEIGRCWASETALLDLVRGVYPNAVHQWRPAFLGYQSIDIYVSSLNLAIEYQGEQHYRSIEIFGGDEGFSATKSRDARKRALLAANGVQLHEWKFDQSLSRVNVESALRKYEIL